MSKTAKILFRLLILILGAVFVVPLLYALYNSFLPLDKVEKLVSLDQFTLSVYQDLFTNYPVFVWLKNTVIVAGLTLLSQLCITVPAGYSLAKLRFPGRSVVFTIVLLTMMVPFQVLLTPQYIMITRLGWNDTLVGLIVPYMMNTLYIFMSRQFYLSFPGDLLEAARVDGLGFFRSFFHIVLPLSKPIVATVTIFNFVQSWNSYMVPSTFVMSEERFTMVVGLNTLKDTYFNRLNLTMAGVVVTCLPLLILFLFLQKHLIRGIASEGIKG